jgi:FAD/FMN-containing dehydrogenase/Fe-S oxidoreductase
MSERGAHALAAELTRALDGDVRFDEGSRALYATDASNYRQVPIGVVLPRHEQDVLRALEACRKHGAPVLARGGGTSLAGQCCNVAVVLDMSRYMNRVLEVDPERRLARVQPGTVLDTLRDAAERHGLTFGPDPSTHNHCTIGGMIGNNSCGVHSVMAGRTDDNIESLDIVTYDGTRMRVGRTSDAELARIIAEGGRQGEIYAQLRAFHDRYAGAIRGHFPHLPRRVSGYNLPALLQENGFHVARALVGSEATCVMVLEAQTRLVPSPPARVLAALGFGDVFEAADHVEEVLAHGPIGLEGMDDRLVEAMKAKAIHPRDIELLPEGGGWLIAEFGGTTREEAEASARAMCNALSQSSIRPSIKIVTDAAQQLAVWKVRESGLGATAFLPEEKDSWEGWEDSAVPVVRLGEYLRALRKLLERFGYACSLYGHFGDGCVHTRIDFDLASDEGIARYRRFVEEAADLVVSMGGSFSGEHGDGQSRAELLPRMFGAEIMAAFREWKAIWDPLGRMNPGKLIDAYRLDQNLRLGAGYPRREDETHFKFPDDDGSLSRATLRCVGVGECRREGGGTMCPSYMVTREEKHSTRGRAHLLWELMQGDVLKDGWQNEHVHEALDLCLACKGCKGDCPVNVDVATYKAEFLAHYYTRHSRPRHAYAFGWIDRWAMLAAHAPRLANLFTQTAGLSALSKLIAGVAQERRVPAFARQTFVAWFRGRTELGQGDDSRPRVMLWPDTFNNHFHPETAKAAVEVLEAAGYRVEIPGRPLCCGRPLYDYGMLDRAKQLLTIALTELRGAISDGVPIVSLEPSCTAVFRDELRNLFPNDEQAQRLAKQSFHLSEFLADPARGYRPPRLRRQAVLHGHCHHKSIMKLAAEEQLLSRMGLTLEVLDAGCCGMAGGFGFEKDHYQLSIAAGERVLLPAVRSASSDTLLITDGFSCREQIEQQTGRHALHLAEVLRMAL